MAELKCKANTCCYNNEGNCCKGNIMVGGNHAVAIDNTCCESFSQRRGENYRNAMERPSRTISIDCEATNCTYNTNYRCCAQQVEIKGCGAAECGQTACTTFQER